MEQEEAPSVHAPSVPVPPHPHRRREPLPWQRPKPPHEDPDALRRIQEIVANPSYRQADEDVDFLDRGDTRGVRLQVDYLKAELLLESHGIEHTIVVFGSTRIQEPGAARRRVEELRAGPVGSGNEASSRSPSGSWPRATTTTSPATSGAWSAARVAGRTTAVSSSRPGADPGSWRPPTVAPSTWGPRRSA